MAVTQIAKKLATLFNTAPALLTAQDQQNARVNVYAAPFDALAFNGLQINGSMEVSQEFGAAVVTLPNAGVRTIADLWGAYYSHASAVVTAAQVSSASFPAPLYGYTAGMQIKATTAMTALVNGNQAQYRHIIEGVRCARLAWGTTNAQPLSYGFWLYSMVTGVIFLRFINDAANRTFYVEHSVVTGWNWCNATVPGDQAGSWQSNTSAGIIIDIFISGKTATPAAPGAWGTAIAGQTTNSTNLLATNNNLTILTGFICVPGSEMPSARSPFFMRPLDQEFLLCKRHWTYLPNNGTGFASTATTFDANVMLSTPMRANPTIAIPAGTVVNAFFIGAYINCNGLAIIQPDAQNLCIRFNISTAAVSAQGVFYGPGSYNQFTCNSRL